MISKVQIQGLILEALQNVKESEPVYQSLALNEGTILLGEGSSLDSIAFTHFVVGFEERMENATGEEYEFQLDKFYDQLPLTVDYLAGQVASQWQAKGA
ncbi:MAG: hypothetical protein EXS63_08920 [Candidatus Omnitrophica bacterium]|nr:hypothetical protein [Candidatus Omnitrophota bacterium]